MLGQDDLLTDVQGLIQSQIGSLLQLRSQLQEMQKSPILTISDKAKSLLVTQTQLEADLSPTISKIQSGDATTSDYITAGGFLLMVEMQIKDVGDLYNQYLGLGSSAQASLISGIPNWMLWVVAGGLIFWKKIKGRKK
jgi:hypothetical protein